VTIDFHEQCEYIEFGGRRWLWPKKDEKLKQVNDWVSDLNTALLSMAHHKRELKVAIQAGGACGVWPVHLAEHFPVVYTFEPDPVNYWCLAANCSHLPSQIQHAQAALGEHPGRVDLLLDASERNNVGAYFTVDHVQGIGEATSPRIKLDDVPLYACDLLCLDIEGREVEALRGAHNLIERFKPFIMIEEKPLPHMGPGQLVPHQVGAATEWLEKIHGYTIVNRVHRDIVLAPPQEEA